VRRGGARHVRQIEALAARAAVVVDDLVLRDAEDPASQRLAVLGRVRRLDRRGERGLDDVLDLALGHALAHHRDERGAEIGTERDGLRGGAHGDVHKGASDARRRV